MKQIFPYKQIIQILSLDVAIGALISGMAVARVAACAMPMIWYVALPLAVWVVYTSDHLLDAWRLKDKASTARHQFHAQYFKPISIVWGIALVTCLTWVMWAANPALRWLGLGIGVLVLIHLGLVMIAGARRSWLIVKEGGVALIYTSGVWGGAWVMCFENFALPLYGLAGMFFLLALLNLLIFSIYEAETDLRDGHTSWVLGVGTKRARRIAGVIAGGAAGLGFTLLLNDSFEIKMLALIQLAMLGVLVCLLLLPKTFGRHALYRLLGDGAFLLPLLYLVEVV
ncbi:MAG: hypothetical protein AB8F95_14715 [Bacteroidia bacterium]